MVGILPFEVQSLMNEISLEHTTILDLLEH